MTVLHLTWLPRIVGYEGILHKQQDLARACTAADLDMVVRVLSHDVGPRPLVQPIRQRRWGRLRKLATMEDSIDFDAYEAVILRYPGAIDLSLPGFLRRQGRRVVTEHHTDERAELWSLPGGRWRVAWESVMGRRFLSGVAGAVAVTAELAERLRARGLTGPATVVANGIDVPRHSWRPPTPWDGNGPLHLLFASGIFWSWQGLDRLLTGLLQAPVGAVTLHLAGRILRTEDCRLLERCHRERPGQVMDHGSLDRSALADLATRVHGAVSTLALHRKGMVEACPLKSREYIAWGLPLVAAYQDPDLPPNLPGVLQIPASDLPVDVVLLRQTWAHWATTWSDITLGLRHHAEHHLDHRAKAAALITFARACVRP